MEEIRVCKQCEIEKPISAFEKNYSKHHTKVYRKWVCMKCRRDKKKKGPTDFVAVDYMFDKTSARGVRSNLKTYNKIVKNLVVDYSYITDEYLNNMVLAQNHECKICGEKDRDIGHRLNLDHNHSTGEIRGMLCRNCNFLVGRARDDKNILYKVISYLE